MCNFVLVGVFEICDLSPIDFVGKYFKIYLLLCICVFWVYTQYSQIFYNTVMYVMSVVGAILNKKAQFIMVNGEEVFSIEHISVQLVHECLFI